jgi:hypothetical protein
MQQERCQSVNSTVPPRPVRLVSVIRKRLLGPALAIVVSGCGSHSGAPQSFAGLVRVSSLSPFPSDCVVGGQGGTNFRNAEVEPFLAVDPKNSRHLVGVWQQDRWSNGGSNGLGSAVSLDGGNTWTTGFAHFTNCSGGNAANRATFQRASDPWVTFGADGTPHHIGFSFDNTSAHSAMLAVRSLDGGRTWTEPVFLTEENNPDVAIDKESITADPFDAKKVYAVWDRLAGLSMPNSPNQTGPAYFTRTTDGGATWEAARVIYDPGLNAQTIANQIVVLPDGTLVNMMTIVTQLDQQSSPARAAVLRSADKGGTWSAPIDVAQEISQGVTDPKVTGTFLRTGDIVPEIAVDPVSGALYVVWEDSRLSSNGTHDGIVLSKSINGGNTWSPPARVNGAPATQAFTPSIAVAQGKVGVTYYDLRNDNPGDNTRLLATAWLAVSSDGGATWTESAVGGPFDMHSAARTVQGYFVGDYQGLVASGANFIPFLVLTNYGDSSNRSDVFARPLAAAAAVELSSPAFTESSFVPARVRRGPHRIF